MPQQIIPKQRTRRGRRALFCVLSAAGLLVAVYAALPWWAPKDYLRRRLAERMTEQLRLPVRIGSLSLGWFGGVRLGGVTVSSPDGFSSAPMVQIDYVEADLSPVRYLFTGRLDRLDVGGLHLRVESDASGRWNVASLGGLSADPIAPRMAVRQASATFTKSGNPQEFLHLTMAEMVLKTTAGRGGGEISLSATLEQQGQPAAIRFHLSHSAGEQTVAVASLGFTNLDMGQLPLSYLLPSLPLRKCAGQAEGWAELHIDNQGVIGQFSVNVSVSKLVVQPQEGPPLPTVDKGGLNLVASLDPITDRVCIQRFEAHLPGADLVGDAELSASLLEGRWEALRSLNVSGRLRPGELAALLSGKAELPAGMEVQGPVAVRLASRYDGARLDLDASADVAATVLRRSGRLVKPAGRAMAIGLKGSLDRRSWQFRVEHAEANLGDNRLKAVGTLGDVRQLVSPETWSGNAWSAVLNQIASSDCSGEWELADWDALNDALAGVGVATSVAAQGPVTGRWFLEHTGLPRLHARAEAGSDARLSIGEAFRQPEATAVVLDLAGTVDAEAGVVRDLNAELAVGTGRLSVDRGVLSRTEGDALSQPPATVLGGQFETQALESLAACLPVLKSWGVNAAGRMAGEFELQAFPRRVEGRIDASMDQATLAAGQFLAKAPGRKAAVQVRITRDWDLPPQERNRLALQGALEAAEISATAMWADGNESAGRATVDARIHDAHRLPADVPLLARRLGEAHLGGQARLTASAQWKGSTLDSQVRCDAGGIEYVSADSPQRIKTPDTPLVVEWTSRWTKRGRGDLDIAWEKARLTSGDEWIQGRGSATIRGWRSLSSDDVVSSLRRVELHLDELRGWIAGKNVAAGGVVTVEDVGVPPGSADGSFRIGHLATDGLELRVGDNHGWLIADLSDLPGETAGSFHFLVQELDDKDLADWIGAVRRLGRVEAPKEAAASQPAASQPAISQAASSQPDRSALAGRADRLIESIRTALAAVALQGRISIDRYHVYDATVDRSYLSRSFEAKLSIEDKQVQLTAAAALKGGIITSRYQLNLAEDAPKIIVYRQVRELMADESIQPQLAKQFPGNMMYGLFSRTENVTMSLRQVVAQAMDPSAPVWPDGSAKTVATDGLLAGRAVPGFVTRIFPGLNLTHYRYNKMTAFAAYEPNGTAINDMVFSGQTYDIYIEGTTDPNNIGRYEIGLILLGTPQSAEWNHTYRQGRIPLLKVKARIEGGQMHDESVTFVYPNESLFIIFLKNNIFYRLWLASHP
ncbi:MAG: hypothetical protein ABSH10_07495 [Phycisphaerae bacterium]|jgi:hypothetical protein